MPRKPREQPATPDTPKAPETPKASLEEKTGVPATPEAAPEPRQRPHQTTQTSAEARVEEGRVPQLERLEPEPISDEELAKLNVYGRWSRIIDEIGLVPKRGWNDHHRYWFTLDADLNAFVGPLFAKYHLVVIPRVTEVERIELPGRQQLTRVKLDVEIINADSEKGEDRFTVPWVGEGADTVDKGVYKAYTGGLKFFYMKLLQVSTGDDPELFTQTDRIGQMAAEAAVTPGGAPRQQQARPAVTSSQRQQPEKGGRQQGTTQVQVNSFKGLVRGLGLSSDPVAAAETVYEVLGAPAQPLLDSVEGMENTDQQWGAIGEWLKAQPGEVTGKLLYGMGEMVKKATSAAEQAAPEEQTAPVAPETESQDSDADEEAAYEAAREEALAAGAEPGYGG